MTEVGEILLKGALFGIAATIIISVGLLASGYVVHRVNEQEECPPYDRCTPTATWNDPNCKCWDNR